MNMALSQSAQSIHSLSNAPKDLGHIGVLMGGYSSEREISLKSGQAVFTALKKVGCQVSAIDISVSEDRKIFDLVKSFNLDVAFIALHGRLGEDGTIQHILEQLDLPYPGSRIEASRCAINKAKTQKMLKQKSIRVPQHVIFQDRSQVNMDFLLASLSFPVVVKPACEGSSIGVTFVQQKEQLVVAVSNAFSYGHEVLVEQFIPGKELTVGILGQDPLPVVEICPKGKFFDFSSKYQSGMTDYIVPANISEKVSRHVQEIAGESHRALGCEDFSRVDLILDLEDQPYVLEINTIPGFTSTSLLPKAAKARGLDFTSLCLRLIQLAYEKKR